MYHLKNTKTIIDIVSKKSLPLQDVDQQRREIIIDKAYELVNRNILSKVMNSQVKYDINHLGYFSEILYNPDNQQDRIDYVINNYYYQ